MRASYLLIVAPTLVGGTHEAAKLKLDQANIYGDASGHIGINVDPISDPSHTLTLGDSTGTSSISWVFPNANGPTAKIDAVVPDFGGTLDTRLQFLTYGNSAWHTMSFTEEGALEVSGSIGWTRMDVTLQSGETLCQRSTDDTLEGCYHPSGAPSATSYMNLNTFGGNGKLGKAYISIEDNTVHAYCVVTFAHAAGWNSYHRDAFREEDYVSGSPSNKLSIDRCGDNNPDMRITNGRPNPARVRVKQVLIMD